VDIGNFCKDGIPRLFPSARCHRLSFFESYSQSHRRQQHQTSVIEILLAVTFPSAKLSVANFSQKFSFFSASLFLLLQRAHLCVYIIQRRPPLNFNNEREVFISWDDVITEALTLSDEHVIKVVMVCKKEADDCSRRHSDNLTTTTMAAKERRFLQIAANTVALIKKFGYTE
jgi:hypothetical protein